MYETLYWYQHEPAQHLARTAHLSVEARAAYDSLRQHAWLSGQRGDPPASLPNDDSQLARLANIGSRWGKVRVELRPFFEVRDDRLVDLDLLRVWEHAVRAFERRSSAGRRGGRPRKDEKAGESPAKPLVKQQQSEAQKEVKRSPSGGAALPPLRLERCDPQLSPDASKNRAALVADWEQRNPDRAAFLRSKVADEFGIPFEKRTLVSSTFAQAQYENFVLSELAEGPRRSANG